MLDYDCESPALQLHDLNKLFRLHDSSRDNPSTTTRSSEVEPNSCTGLVQQSDWDYNHRLKTTILLLWQDTYYDEDDAEAFADLGSYNEVCALY